MTKSGNKERKKLSSSSSAEAAYSAKGKGDEAFESERSTAMATNEGVNGTPSFIDAWNVLTEIKVHNSSRNILWSSGSSSIGKWLDAQLLWLPFKGKFIVLVFITGFSQEWHGWALLH